MLTIISSVILFGFGGWFSTYTCFSIYRFGDYIVTNIDYSFAILVGCALGLMIGLGVSILISRFVAHKYPRLGKKIYLLNPLSSDWKTYLVTNENGDVTYCGPGENVQTIPKAEAEIEVKESESPPFITPHFIISYPERASFWGLFATFFTDPHYIFVVSLATMIKKGRVDIITTTKHKLVLESEKNGFI